VDVGQQLDIAFRLVLASLLGLAVGFEREIHGHPAGMRTHLLVSLGSAAFTILGVFFFSSPGTQTDPSRIAAQIVTGIGFLGAGAILKYGTSVRGLTTAASLWATAAVGMAAGAGAWLVAIVTTVLVVLSLGPLNWVIARMRTGQPHPFRLRVQAVRLEAVGEISRALTRNRIEIVAVSTQRLGKGRYEIELDLVLPPAVKDEAIIAMLAGVADMEILESIRAGE
jgi:putative Mg2+ transporter-C (MgtC) family protein